MDKSRGSSSYAVSGSKRSREGSTEAAFDLDYEAALRSKLEAERAARTQVDQEREAWAAGLEWLQHDERAGAAAATLESTAGAGSGSVQAPTTAGWGSAVADP